MAAKEFHHGDQDPETKQETYSAFMEMTKWACVVLAATLSLLVIWFCTPLGFLPGAIVAVILLVLGFMFLGTKPKPYTAG